MTNSGTNSPTFAVSMGALPLVTEAAVVELPPASLDDAEVVAASVLSSRDSEDAEESNAEVEPPNILL